MKIIREIIDVTLFLVEEVNKGLRESPDLGELEKRVYRVVNEASRRVLQAWWAHLDERLLHERDKKRLDHMHKKSRSLVTPFGVVTIERRYYVDRETGEGRYLLDEVLGLEPRQRLSPWMRQIAAALASEMPYHRAAKVLRAVTLENVDIPGMTIWQEVQAMGAELRRQAAGERQKVFEHGEVPAGDRQTERLYVEADEVWVRGRGKWGRRGHVAVKLAVGYEGKTEVAPGRRRLEQRRVHAGVLPGPEFWDECVARYGQHWDLGAVAEYMIGGDGAAWVKAGGKHFPGATYRLDPFHLRRALLEALSHDEQAYQRTCEGLAARDWEAVKQRLTEAERCSRGAARRRVAALRRYLESNWEGICALDAGGCLGTMEGQVFHHLARRMKRHGARWSEAGADHLARLLAARANGEALPAVRAGRQGQPETVQRLLGTERLVTARRTAPDPEQWLRAQVPALCGPAAGMPWVKYVLRRLGQVLPNTA